jgi:hypothetical protein
VLAGRGDVLEYIVLLIMLDLMYRLADAFEILRERKTHKGNKPMRAGWRAYIAIAFVLPGFSLAGIVRDIVNKAKSLEAS